jgi:hypothetical protein
MNIRRYGTVDAHSKSSWKIQQNEDIHTRQMALRSSADREIVVSGSRCIRQDALVSRTSIYRESRSRGVHRWSSRPSHVRMVGGQPRRPFIRWLMTGAEAKASPSSICLSRPLRKVRSGTGHNASRRGVMSGSKREGWTGPPGTRTGAFR